MERRRRRRKSSTTIPQDENDVNTSPFSQVATRTVRRLATLSAHPLVSAAVAASVLGILYLPRCILALVISPVPVFTLLLLVTLLYFGSSPRQYQPKTDPSPEQRRPFHSVNQRQLQQQGLLPLPSSTATPDEDREPAAAVAGFAQEPLFLADDHQLVEWPRLGPLEVIYEDYEGEKEEEDDDVVDFPGRSGSPERRLCSYGDDDSEDEPASNSGCGLTRDRELPDNSFFQWEVEDEGLIEIPLEEDNLIEIDISACSDITLAQRDAAAATSCCRGRRRRSTVNLEQRKVGSLSIKWAHGHRPSAARGVQPMTAASALADRPAGATTQLNLSLSLISGQG